MHNYRDTFVSPADGEIPRLQPLARLQDIEAQEIDAGSLFSRTPIHTHERRDPLTEAHAFMLKYLGLTVILLVLAVGLTLRMEWHYTAGIVTFALLATAAYWLLSFTESQFTGPGVERHRLTVGGRVLLAQISAEREVRMAQIDLQADQLAAQREINQHTIEAARARSQAQLTAHGTPRNQDASHPDAADIAGLVPPGVGADPVQNPRVKPAHAALLAFIVELYERDEAGAWVRMDPQGYISNSVPVPWGKRGGYSQTERHAMLDLLYRARLAGFDDGKRAWRVRVGRYPEAQDAIDALAGVGGF